MKGEKLTMKGTLLQCVSEFFRFREAEERIGIVQEKGVDRIGPPLSGFFSGSVEGSSSAKGKGMLPAPSNSRLGKAFFRNCVFLNGRPFLKRGFSLEKKSSPGIDRTDQRIQAVNRHLGIGSIRLHGHPSSGDGDRRAGGLKIPLRSE